VWSGFFAPVPVTVDTSQRDRYIWIARHGNRIDFVRPEWFDTAERPYDPHLSPDGLLQAKELADRLGKETIDHIFASPFVRTVETAHAVAHHLGVPLKLEWGLCEWLNPDWMPSMPETLPLDFLAQEFPRVDRAYQSRVRPTYPETEAQMRDRCARTARILADEFPGNLLFVGHGASVLGTAHALAGTNVTIRAALCCLVQLRDRGDGWIVELAGDTSHLSSTEGQVRFR